MEQTQHCAQTGVGRQMSEGRQWGKETEEQPQHCALTGVGRQRKEGRQRGKETEGADPALCPDRGREAEGRRETEGQGDRGSRPSTVHRQG